MATLGPRISLNIKKCLAIHKSIIILSFQAPLAHEDWELGISFHLAANGWCDLLGVGTAGGEVVNI